MQTPEPPPVQRHIPSAEFGDLLNSFNTPAVKEESTPGRLVIKLPPMPSNEPSLRRSSRTRTGSAGTQNSPASGSEYHESEKSVVEEENHAPETEESPEPIAYTRSQRGRKVKIGNYRESASEDDPIHDIFDDDVDLPDKRRKAVVADDDDSDHPPRITRNTRSSHKRTSNEFIATDDDDEEDGQSRYSLRNKSKRPPPPPTTSSGRVSRQPARFSMPTRPKRSTRNSQRAAAAIDDGYVDEPSGGSADGDGSLDDAPHTSSDIDMDADGEIDPDGEGEPDNEIEVDDRPYSLRQRTKTINYAIPPPLEETRPPPKGRSGGGRTGGRAMNGRNRGPGWSATGAELSKWMGMPGGDDSDSDFATRTPRKPFGTAGMFGGAVSGGGAGMLPGDLVATAGTPSNLGKVGDAALADADPLGVNTNVTFDEVGGLDDHIHSLKEMTLLPLLYPEVFQQFNLTPPRGVLFHGPPGTGKTLLARALAASCRANGKGISFFMRKGADCLSKWVGEAERQLRLLFEEARNCQPSIIFFDEIDGLAPVRSSKQDQIHASIVSTLLALMDGMDGRGQVIVIGATNRPDAIDPALRRPGRFDREFYFPLPSLEARERILTIMTRDWENWSGEKGVESVKGLAKLTKGYGGADLRALCTEAALNAIQRRYPQIYQSNDRLLLKPETIGITLRDFMISIKKLVPSSARSSSSAASPLPNQLVPLLGDTVDVVKCAINKVLPVAEKRTALEEAQWEDGSEEGALEREMLMQTMETLRVYRPRLVLYGPPGMGQGYIGAAALHLLEGYHVQNLDLGTLMGDSTRTVEAAVVQLFVEAKRHQPSVIYIPSLIGWCAAVSETSRSTVRAMLDSLAPTDPILLLAIVDGSFTSLPRDVRAWFGPMRENRVELPTPTAEQRESFFASIIADVRRPPNQFADGVKRKKRVLEELPIAPPLEPRQPTAAELALQEENDQRIATLLKYRLGPILTELKRKFKRFTKRAAEEYDYDFENPNPNPPVVQAETVITNVTIHAENGNIELVGGQQITQEGVEPQINGVQAEPPIPQPQPPPRPQLFDVDLEKMHVDLYKDRYLTPQNFLDDIFRIVHNASVHIHEDPERLYKAQAMLTAARVSIQDFDPQFRLECERMAEREQKRRDERRKAKGKGKAPEDGPNGTLSIRRSARNNGQQPEITITDPLQLERRLKRQRSGERPSGSPVSGEEKVGNGTGSPSSKRMRVVNENDDHDPMDLLGPDQFRSGPGTVRFAQDEPMERSTPPITIPNGLTNDMVVDTPHKKSSAFEFLLNPMPLAAPRFPSPSIHHILNGTDSAGTPPIASNDPFQAPDFSIPANISPPRTPVPTTPALVHDPMPMHEHTTEQQPRISPPVEQARSPTPLPEFHVDEDQLSSLQYDLQIKTAQLTVEQLEQLRASCLGCVWRHKSQWNRYDLVRELKDIVAEFLDDVALNADGELGMQINDAF
ncbi:AAA-domain-containing protein [Hygrophoropsis aurantiaca]|uniref:AAA-domain-containing protein n=1 Tax=Hygrophoropsis aurantiaca TaxID=72124 RepID=A0ACB8ATG7_9AGAM|nr:AAA-domain-containing protein [Hygrophoropsis aurantiaca]